jgi:hypothetical protein
VLGNRSWNNVIVGEESMKINKFIFFILIIISTACSPSNLLKELQENNQLQDTIYREKDIWEELGIDNYQVEVSYAGRWRSYTVITRVKDNKILDFEVRCDPGNEDYCKELPTKPYFSPDDYTIQGIFASLEKSRYNFRKEGDSSWSDSVEITFDSQYHYPKLIYFDILEVWDDEHMIAVQDFKILDE